MAVIVQHVHEQKTNVSSLESFEKMLNKNNSKNLLYQHFKNITHNFYDLIISAYHYYGFCHELSNGLGVPACVYEVQKGRESV